MNFGKMILFVLVSLSGSALLATATVSEPNDQHLIVIGGGDYPPSAMKQFVEWAGGKKAKIVAIHWGTEEEEADLSYLKSQLDPYQPASLERVPLPTGNPAPITQILELIRSSTGIFFGGGDQNIIMARASSNLEILKLIRQKYLQGTVIAGTSAGTAIASKTMLTGEADLTVIDPGKVGTAPGFGFLPHIIVDQHFVKRQRMNRLLGVLASSQERYGLGIDESTAVSLINGRYGRVHGVGKVLRLEKCSTRTECYSLGIHGDGETFLFE